MHHDPETFQGLVTGLPKTLSVTSYLVNASRVAPCRTPIEGKLDLCSTFLCHPSEHSRWSVLVLKATPSTPLSLTNACGCIVHEHHSISLQLQANGTEVHNEFQIDTWVTDNFRANGCKLNEWSRKPTVQRCGA